MLLGCSVRLSWPPKLLTDALPVAAEPEWFEGVAEGLPLYTAYMSQNNLYTHLIKLCNQFFPAGNWTITEVYGKGIINIDSTQLSDEELFFFKKGLFYIRPIGVMVNLNGESALLPYDYGFIA